MADDNSTQSDPMDESRMSFTEHLGELRTRIVRSAIALAVAALGCYIFSNTLIEILARPIAPLNLTDLRESVETLQAAETEGAETPSPAEGNDTSTPVPAVARDQGAIVKIPASEAPQDRRITWTVMSFIEIVFVKVKLAGYGGALVAFPYILYQVCAFVFPGLKPREKRAAKIIIGGCCSLACAGVAVAYWGILPLIVPYLMKAWVPQGIALQLRVNENLSLVIKGLAGFGIIFQFPMVVLVLVYLDLLTPETLKQYRRVAIVGMAVVAAMLTPPDPITMLVLLIPLVTLYEGSILVSHIVVRARRKKAVA